MNIAFTHVNNLIIATPKEEHFDLRCGTVLKSETLRYMNGGHKHLLLDFSYVKTIDSSGLGNIINIGQRLLGIKGSLSFCCVGDAISPILRTTNIHTLFSIYNDQATAIAHYNLQENLPLIAYVGTHLPIIELLSNLATALVELVVFANVHSFVKAYSDKKNYKAIILEENVLSKEFIDFLQQEQPLKRLPQILISFNSNLEHLKSLKNFSKISHHITFPFSESEALMLLNELIESSPKALSEQEMSPVELLFRQYAETLLDKQQELEKLFTKLEAEPSESTATALQAFVHKLSGSAGSYGYVKAGEASRQLERLLDRAIKEKAINSLLVKEAKELLHKIKFHFNASLYKNPNQQNVAIRPIASKSLFLISQNEGLCAFFKKTASDWNFKIVISNQPDRALSHLQELDFKPELVITENAFHSSALDGVAIIRAIKSKFAAEKMKFAILVEEDSLDVSLKATVEGIDFIIKKPPSSQHVAHLFQRLSNSSNGSSYKILVVDDDIDIGNLVANAMHDYNTEVKILTDESKILETLCDFRPNLLLLDIHLNKYNGWSLLKTLRSDLRYRDLKIIIITSSVEAKDIRHKLHDDLWLKPLDKVQLQNALLHLADQSAPSSEKEPTFTSFTSHSEFKKLATALFHAVKGQDPFYLVIIGAKEFSAIKESGSGAIEEYLIATENLMSENIAGDSLRGYLGSGKFGFIFPPTNQAALEDRFKSFCIETDYKVIVSTKNGDVFVTFAAKVFPFTPNNRAVAEFIDQASQSLKENLEASLL